MRAALGSGRIGGYLYHATDGVARTPSGAIVIVGATKTPSTYRDIFTATYTADGTQKWRRDIASGDDDFPGDVVGFTNGALAGQSNLGDKDAFLVW